MGNNSPTLAVKALRKERSKPLRETLFFRLTCESKFDIDKKLIVNKYIIHIIQTLMFNSTGKTFINKTTIVLIHRIGL
ncbi:hypothetical protein, partial [Xylanibacter caecicola]|uniref:hypothetical protein n=1 Tax=Xylanibacter caecicola TaxID=2736294 RepID=UPI00259CAAD5